MRSKSALESPRAEIAKIEGRARRTTPVLPFGVRALDTRLPSGALHEVAGGGGGAAAALFVAGLAAPTKGKVLWCITRSDLFAPALAQAGLSPDRVLYVEAGDDTTVLACMEEGLPATVGEEGLITAASARSIGRRVANR